MAHRVLPLQRNPLLGADVAPDHAELVSKRRLGQTDLKVKPGQIGTSNATRVENLGMFDYAHLRVPLPKDLKGSEIFALHDSQPHPEAYFLMRRSSDGYISATGMFKAAFPWAKHSEELAERNHIKSLPTTSHDEVAGNVWIPETYALKLAGEYGIIAWIRALLDPAPIVKNSDDPKKSISPPPKFIFTANDRASLPPPASNATPSISRGRGRPRVNSPIKSTTPAANKVASPRKIRPKKASKANNTGFAREASASLQASLDSAASIADSESIDGERVRVEVDTAVEVNGDTETTHTNVKVEMPAGSSDMPLPESTEEMIAKAKEMVAEARKLEGEVARASKRKAEVLDEDDEDDEEKDTVLQPAKKARVLERELKVQMVRNRALIGVAATLAIGAIIPYVF